MGFRLHHHLLRLLRTGSTRPLAPVIANSFDLVPYKADALDNYVTLDQASFIDHPTPRHLDAERIRTAQEKPEFDPNSIWLNAIEGDAHRPVAFVQLKPKESETGAPRGSIALLGVLPAYRGRGFARQLLRWSVTSFIDQGIGETELEVVTNNDRALPLYTGEGFVQVHAWPYWMPATPQSS